MREKKTNTIILQDAFKIKHEMPQDSTLKSYSHFKSNKKYF